MNIRFLKLEKNVLAAAFKMFCRASLGQLFVYGFIVNKQLSFSTPLP